MDTKQANVPSTSGRSRVERIMSLVAVLAMLAASASSALASPLPAAPGDPQYLAGPDTSTGCTQQLAPSTTPGQQTMPPFVGSVGLRNASLGYELWRPAGWSTTVSGNNGSSIYLAPDQQDLQAHFSIYAFETGIEPSGADLAALIERYDQVERERPDAQVQWKWDWWSGNMLSFDVEYNYHNGGTQAHRWVRWLYVGTRAYMLTAEAPAGDEYDRLAPSFLAMMMTFRIGEQQD